MTEPFATRLPNRTAIRIAGADRVAFMQSLVSNDVTKAASDKAVYAALLTPQGKFLHDLFILDQNNSFLVDCEMGRAEDLIGRLQSYKLRSKVTFEDLSLHYEIWAIWDEDPITVGFPDPRLHQLGNRAFIEKGQTPSGTIRAEFPSYDTHRMALGIADGSRDMELEKSNLGDFNFEYLNGVNWEKGCYIGQELTARMHYRRLGKKRFLPVRISGRLQNESDEVFFRGTSAGRLCSHDNNIGVALLSIEAVNMSLAQKVPLSCGNQGLSPYYPDWLILD